MNTPEQNTEVKQNPTVEDAVALLVSELPLSVQQFVTGPERARVALTLSQKYNLHVDQAGEFERSFIFMLIGISTPEEFVENLKEAGLTPEQVRGLTEDVNKEVFMKLREAEKNQPVNPPPVQPVAPRPAPQPIQITPRSPVPIYSPLPSTPSLRMPPPYVTEATERPPVRQTPPPPPVLPGQMPEPPVPQPVVPAPPRIETPIPVPMPPVVHQAPPQPANDPHHQILHTMARDMEALKSGVDPFRVAHPAPPAWTQTPTPPRPPVATPAPREQLITPPPAPASVPPPAVPASTAPQAPSPLQVHLKQYGVDPYRETVE